MWLNLKKFFEQKNPPSLTYTVPNVLKMAKIIYSYGSQKVVRWWGITGRRAGEQEGAPRNF